MKEQIIEVGFIGGLDPLTEEEGLALARYFADKKQKSIREKQNTRSRKQPSSTGMDKRSA